MFLHIIKKEEYNQNMTSGVYKRTSKNRENLSKSLKKEKLIQLMEEIKKVL